MPDISSLNATTAAAFAAVAGLIQNTKQTRELLESAHKGVN